MSMKKAFLLLPVEYDDEVDAVDDVANIVRTLLDRHIRFSPLPKLGDVIVPARQFASVDDPNYLLDELGEVSVLLANGGMIVSGWDDEHDPGALVSGAWLKLLDPDGQEFLYYDSDEWTTNDEGRKVIGAFINACAGMKQVPGREP